MPAEEINQVLQRTNTVVEAWDEACRLHPGDVADATELAMELLAVPASLTELKRKVLQMSEPQDFTPLISISKHDLFSVLVNWEVARRAGECRPTPEADALPVAQRAEEGAEYLWRSLQELQLPVKGE